MQTQPTHLWKSNRRLTFTCPYARAVQLRYILLASGEETTPPTLPAAWPEAREEAGNAR